MTNRQVRVTELPKGALTQNHFEVTETETPVPETGQVLVKTILISIDAAMRAWMQGATYRAPSIPAMPCRVMRFAK